MKQISFAFTTPQFRARTKSVTRRRAWWNAKPGLHLLGVEKSQGLRKGERVVVLGEIVLISVRQEPLNRLILEPEYGAKEMILEGFPDLDPAEFAYRFALGHACLAHDIVTRLEFEYVTGRAG